MNKKGFTLVELITTFALASVVLVLLVNIIVMIKNIYTEYDTKTELLVNQANLSKYMNDKFNESELVSYTVCSSDSNNYHYNFQFKDNSNVNLKVTKDKIVFDKFTYKIIEGVNIGNVELQNDSNIFSLKIPITSKLYSKENFGINLVYIGEIEENEDKSVCS